MILYFNDYKLIYIITMMGKINNIPVLNEDVIRLVVLNEEIIGYIYPRRTSYVVALEIKPGRTTSLATSVNKQCMVLLSDKVRLATEQDFDDFHICFDGFRNNTMHSVISETIKAYMKIIEILFRGQTNLITQQNHALFIDRCSQRGSTSRLYLQCHHIRSPSWIDIPNNFLIEYNQTNNIFIQNGNIINFAHHCYNINQFIIIKIQYHHK